MIYVEACISGDCPVAAARYAEAAFEGGAQTIELCAAMDQDGLTPPIESVEAARAAFNAPGLMAMIRPRGGDFCYSKEAQTQMAIELDAVAQAGVDGVVFGMLNEAGGLDIRGTRAFVERARSLGLKTTFHRAFDALNDPLVALETLVEAGVDRILTSGIPWGRAGSALDGINQLNQVIQLSKGRIEIVIAGSVSSKNVPEIIEGLEPWTGRIGLHAYSGTQAKGETTTEAVRSLVESVAS